MAVDMMDMETHMVQIPVQHMQQGVQLFHLVIEVIVMALPSVIHLVIVVIHKHVTLYMFFFYVTLTNVTIENVFTN